MGVKLKIEEIKDKIGEKGYTLLDELEIKNTKSRVSITDELGYRYYTRLENILVGKPYKFHKDNPYSIYNIKNYIKSNNINSMLRSDIYKSNKEILDFECECGELFNVSWNEFQTGQTKCKKCTGGLNREKKAIEEVINLIRLKGFDVSDDFVYINNKAKFLVVDMYGYKYSVNCDGLNSDNAPEKFSKYNPYTIENIRLWLKLNNYTNKLVSDKWKNSDSKLTFTCELCNNEYDVSFKHFRNANQTKCKKCTNNIRTLNDRLPNSIVVDLFKENGLTLLDAHNYLGVNTPLECMDIYGYKYTISYGGLKNGFPEKFVKHNKYTIDNIKLFIEIEGYTCELISDQYLDSKSPLIFKCECGEMFKTKFNNLFLQNKFRCDKCSKNQSIYSKKFEDFLKNSNLNYEKEYRIDECRHKRALPFDYCVFVNDEINLIEIDGVQHFKPTNFNGISTERAIVLHDITKRNDEIKNKFCSDNNIRLIRIPYYLFDSNDKFIKYFKSKINT